MTPNSPGSRLTLTQWLICFVAAVGFAFDIYELLMLPLVIGPALKSMAQIQPGSPEFRHWFSLLFYVPAVAGGAFGLLGGYLTDLFGRRRVLVYSILLYALSAVAAGLSTTPEMFLLFRTTTFIGVCVEFVAAVAWLAELFPDHKRREAVLGFTQAFSSLGGLMVTFANDLAVIYANSLPSIHGAHESWRYTLISGVIPALPLMIIRPFLPESPAWLQKKAAGTLRRPSIGELFQPAYRRTSLVTALLFAMSYGVAFGAIQQLPTIVRGLSDVAPLAVPLKERVVNSVQYFQEIGGLTGRIILAALAVVIVSRRKLLWIFQVPGLLIVPLVFYYAASGPDLSVLKAGVFLSGLLVVAQFSFWGNYLPRVYPLHLRGTGEGFAANVGGRMVGTAFAAVTAQLSSLMPGVTPSVKIAFAASVVALCVFVVAFVASFQLPEPKRELME
jgi:MFS family permease